MYILKPTTSYTPCLSFFLVSLNFLIQFCQSFHRKLLYRALFYETSISKAVFINLYMIVLIFLRRNGIF